MINPSRYGDCCVFLGVCVVYEADCGNHLPSHQYLLSLLAFLVYLFLPFEKIKETRVH